MLPFLLVVVFFLRRQCLEGKKYPVDTWYHLWHENKFDEYKNNYERALKETGCNAKLTYAPGTPPDPKRTKKKSDVVQPSFLLISLELDKYSEEVYQLGEAPLYQAKPAEPNIQQE